MGALFSKPEAAKKPDPQTKVKEILPEAQKKNRFLERQQKTGVSKTRLQQRSPNGNQLA